MGGVERLSMRRARFVVLAVLVAAVTVRVVSGGTSAAPPLDGQAAGLQRSLPSRTAPALPNRRAHADADTAPNVHAPSPLCRPRARRRDARRHRWPAQGAPRRRAPARGLGARRQPRHRHLAAAGGRSAMRGLGPVGTVASDGRTLADQPREVRALFTAQWGPTQAA